jgi:tetratricopeptide (TPR) repeat protein
MRWVQSEYAMKGLFLGLLLYTAMQIEIAPAPADGVSRTAWERTGSIALYMLGGLGAAIVLGLLRQLRDLVRIIKKPHASLVFLLLENPLLIYLGLIGGLCWGAVQEYDPGAGTPNLIVLSISGAILGYGFGELRNVKDVRYRLGLAIGVGATVVYAIDMYLQQFPGGMFSVEGSDERKMLGYIILLGLPFYYLLCFVGIAEESEAEIAGLCVMLGLSIHLLKFPDRMPAAGFLMPVAIYFTYVMYVLPGLLIFKHTLRGYAYMEIGKLRPALLCFRRALQLDPANALAHHGMDALHANLEIDKVDAATLGLLDPNRCLKRARLLLARKPTADEMHKAEHVLNLVEKLWPKLVSHVVYYRAVAKLHAGAIAEACGMLNDLLNPEGWFPDDAARKTILFDAWQLSLLAHPILRQRVGEPQLALPGRRMEAIGAVERQLTIQPGEPTIVELRQALYADLQEPEYFEAAKEAPPVDFAHHYAEELGLKLIGDPERWQRGAQYLRMAANGLPLRRPSIFARLAEAYAKAGETLQATRYLQYVRDSGLEVGLPNLPADQRTVYYSTVRRLAEEAAARSDFDEAIYNFSLATNAPDSGVPTLRALAEMYEKKLDVMNALRITEKALCYDGRDPDLLAKKDKYYFSLEIDALARTAKEDDNVRKYFDVAYCVKKSKSVLDAKSADLDTLDWAHHLVSLALVMQPQNLIALVQKARLHLRRGERQEGLTILEDVREMKPSGSEESDTHYFVLKQLGKLYLDELNRADLAIPCFLEYLNHVGSGAETLYDLGRAYEAVGDKANAIKHYKSEIRNPKSEIRNQICPCKSKISTRTTRRAAAR